MACYRGVGARLPRELLEESGPKPEPKGQKAPEKKVERPDDSYVDTYDNPGDLSHTYDDRKKRR